MKKVLAVDSFSKILSIAVSNGKEIFLTETEPEMRHSELAMDIIDALMKKASLTPSDLQGVLCLQGPGSFTGLRIGYSIAKGLALSLSIPFAAIPTLDCIAYQGTANREQLTENREQGTENSVILPIIEARKNSYFYAFFKGEERLTQVKEGDCEQIIMELKQLYAPQGKHLPNPVLTGPASAAFFEIIPQEMKQTIILNYEGKGYADTLIHLANKRKILDNDTSSFLCSGPEYIRVSDAELNKK